MDEVVSAPPKKENKLKIALISLLLTLIISVGFNIFLISHEKSLVRNSTNESSTNANSESSISSIVENWSLLKSSKKGYAFTLFNGQETPSIYIYSIDEKKLVPTNIDEGPGGSAHGFGISGPITSPNFLHTAYRSRDGNLWILSNDTLEKKKATNNGRVSLLSGWSKDSKNLVYSVGGVIPWNEGMPSRPTDVKKLPNFDPPGFYNLNIETGEITYLFPLKSFLGFIDNERILTTDGIGSTEGNAGTIEVFNINTFEMDYTITDNGFGFGVSQYQFDPEGKRWIFTYSDLVNKFLDDSTEVNIILADFPKKTGTVIDTGSWAEVQRPRFSPDGKKIAYLKRASIIDGYPQHVVTVYDIASKSLKNYSDGTVEAWLGPDLILFRENGGNSSKDSKHFILNLIDSSVTQVN